jgi:hypothetical protein
MKNFLAPLCFLLIVTAGCAQQKPVAEKAYAFYRISHPGNIPVDDQGNPEQRVDTVYQVYLESGSQAPDIVYVSIHGLQYHAVAVQLEEVEVGKRTSDNKTILLRARPGYALWQLDLSAPVGAANSQEPVISIREGKKTIRRVALPQPVELVPEERY